MTYTYDRRAAYIYDAPGRVSFLGSYYPWVATYETRDKIDAKIREAAGARKVERQFDWTAAREVPGGWQIPWTATGTFKGKGGMTPRELTSGVDTVTLEPEGSDVLRLHLDSKCPEVAVSFPYRDPDYKGVVSDVVNALLRAYRISEPHDVWSISALGGRKAGGGWQIPFEASAKGISGTLIITSKPEAAKTGQKSVFLAFAAEAIL